MKRLKNIAEAVRVLRRGGLVIYPTETAYALGADALNEEAVKKIFAAKGRRKEISLPVIVADLTMAEAWAHLSPNARELAHIHWPGALTLIVEAKRKFPRALSQTKTIALRVSANSTARALSRALGRPIVSTSANLSGQPASYSVRRIKKYFGRSPEFISVLDGGTLPRRKVSTIVDCTGRRLKLVRPGRVKIAILE